MAKFTCQIKYPKDVGNLKHHHYSKAIACYSYDLYLSLILPYLVKNFYRITGTTSQRHGAQGF